MILQENMLLKINHLKVRKGKFNHLEDINLTLSKGSSLGIVGENGSGKTWISQCIMGFYRYRSDIEVFGDITYYDRGNRVRILDQYYDTSILGKRITYIRNDIDKTFSPHKNIIQQITSFVGYNDLPAEDKELQAYLKQLLDEVGINPKAYPHQLNKKQLHLTSMVMGVVTRPDLIIAHKDGTLDDMDEIRNKMKSFILDHCKPSTALILLSNDLHNVSELVDYVMVIEKGNIVEHNHAKEIINNPKHPYTQSLVAFRKHLEIPLKYIPTRNDFVNHNNFEKTINFCAKKRKKPSEDKPILEVQKLIATGTKGKFRLRSLDFTVSEHEVLGIKGHTGSGKTLLSKTILRYIPQSRGKILHKGEDILQKQLIETSNLFGLIDEYPKHFFFEHLTIRKNIFDEMNRYKLIEDVEEEQHRLGTLVEECHIPSTSLDCFPRQLNTFQLQRLLIVKALMMRAKILVWDDPLKHLEISQQVQLLNLLSAIKQNNNAGHIFLSRDGANIQFVSDRIMYMQRGKLYLSEPETRKHEA